MERLSFRKKSKRTEPELIEKILSELHEMNQKFNYTFENILEEVPSDCPAPSYDEFFIYFFLGSTLTIPYRLIEKIKIKSVHFNLSFTDKGTKILRLVFEVNKGSQTKRLVLRTIITHNRRVLNHQYYSETDIQEIIKKLNLKDHASLCEVDALIYHINLLNNRRILKVNVDNNTKRDFEHVLQEIQENIQVQGYEVFKSIVFQNKDFNSEFESALEKLSKEIITVEKGVVELFKSFIEVCKKNEDLFPRVGGRSEEDHNRYKESRFHGFIYGALKLNFKSKYGLDCYVERSSGMGGGADLTLISRKDEFTNRKLDAVPVIVELKSDQPAAKDGLHEVKRNVFSNIRTFSDEAVIACVSLWSTEGKNKKIVHSRERNKIFILQEQDELIVERCKILIPKGLVALILCHVSNKDLIGEEVKPIIIKELECLHHSIPPMGKISNNCNYFSRLVLGEILSYDSEWDKFVFICENEGISKNVTTFLLQHSLTKVIVILNIMEFPLKKRETNFEFQLQTIPINGEIVINSDCIYQVDVRINPVHTKRFSCEGSSSEKYLQLLEIKKESFEEYKKKTKYNGELRKIKSVHCLYFDERKNLSIITAEELNRSLNEIFFPINELIAPVVQNERAVSNNQLDYISKNAKNSLLALIHGLFIGEQDVAKKCDKIIKILAKTSIGYKRYLDLCVSIASMNKNIHQEDEAIAICTSEPISTTLFAHDLKSLFQKIRARVHVVSFNGNCTVDNEWLAIKSNIIDVDHTSIGEEDIKDIFLDATITNDTRALKDLFRNETYRKQIVPIFDIYRTGLICALEMCHCYASKLILQEAIEDQKKDLLNSAVEDSGGKKIKHLAVLTGNLKLVEYFIQQGADISDFDSKFLYSLKRKDDMEMLKFLIEKGINPNSITSSKNRTLLHSVDLEEDMVDFLINKGIDVNSEDYVCRTPLHYAAYANDLSVVELLLHRDAKVSSDEFGKTPLHYAKERDVIEVLEEAIENQHEMDNIDEPIDYISDEEICYRTYEERYISSSEGSEYSSYSSEAIESDSSLSDEIIRL